MVVKAYKQDTHTYKFFYQGVDIKCLTSATTTYKGRIIYARFCDGTRAETIV